MEVKLSVAMQSRAQKTSGKSEPGYVRDFPRCTQTDVIVERVNNMGKADRRITVNEKEVYNILDQLAQWSFNEIPTRLTIARLRDKFEDEETVQNIHKNNSRRPRTSTSPTREREVIERFQQSPRKSVRQAARETGLSK
ncbi:hypothetical protein ANN_00752 [Periplaneta americana]|uniref:Uncharacterized protein n=1 Tax=Periplaneta americana TaxID=6978 RepID=A0ABQ8TRU3_PERAM|nr:hypothetical protein ANN_00752 [Periplaneta americana]